MTSYTWPYMCGRCGGIAGVSMTRAGYLGWTTLARRHRLECLKIPRVYRHDPDWWVINYPSGNDMWCGSWERAVEAALMGSPA